MAKDDNTRDQPAEQQESSSPLEPNSDPLQTGALPATLGQSAITDTNAFKTAATPAAGSDPFRTGNLPPTSGQSGGAAADAFGTAPAPAAPEPAYTSETPTTIGRFHVRKKLGTGAFGVVYRAYDPQLDREVAIKVAKPNAVQSEESGKNFLREARAAANLRHPNIVPVFDSGMDGAQYFIASAFIPGKTLAHAMRAAQDQGFEPRRSAQLIRHLAEALAYAHKKTVIHRDVKPANVLLDEQGEPLLADFGLARRNEGKALRSRALRREAAPTDGPGQDGTQMAGTPAYMAPEQAVGDAVAASDQYSLGVVFYELLTGQLPFVGDLLEQIEHHKFEKPTAPRKLRPKVPRDLEAICLRCLKKDPAKRYADCQALADDLRRWLEDEPVTARRWSLRERLVHWVHKEPKLAAALAAVAVVMALAIVLLGREQAKTSRAQRERALAQVDALLDVSPEAVPSILQGLEPFRALVNPRLRELRNQPGLSDARRTRVSLALLPVDAGEVDYLRQRLLHAEPDELLLIRSALLPHRAQLRAGLWALVTDAHADPDQRFRCVVVLAAFDPDDPRWRGAGDRIVARFLGANPLHLGTWVEALRPVRRALIEPLCKVFRDQPELRRAAATVLIDYAADDPEVLAELLTEADAGHFAFFWPGIKAHGQRASARLIKELQAPLPDEDKPDARDALAQRQATAAVALLQLGNAELVWPLLRHSADPTRRSYLLHYLGRLGASPEPLLQRLEAETDVAARRALILSLGEFTAAQLPAARRKPLVKTLLDWYRNDPDPGIHGAVDWLLRHGKQGPLPRKLDWGQTAALERIDRELAGQPPGERRWYVNRAGLTMTIVPGPVAFFIGSPAHEVGRLEKNEDQVLKRIPRSFAMASKSVTVAQFRRFLEANPKVKEQHSYTAKYSPDDGGPIISVTWFEAAQYCNWLSAQEGIPEDQWCYPPIDDIKEGMVMPKDYLQRTGYRLPTEAEWEFACRAGAGSTFSYGCSEPLLSEYAWYRKNSADRAWPVGQLKPNDLGLFDIHGNVWNWCQCRFLEYKVGDDVEDMDVTVTGLQSRSLRGAAFNLGAVFARSADRNGNRPSNRSDGVGFLPARTWK